MVVPDQLFRINNTVWKDVTNQTVCGAVFNWEEAVAYSYGHSLSTSGPCLPENKEGESNDEENIR